MGMTRTKGQTAINPWAALALVCLPVFIGALDLTIVSAFLPEIIVGLELPVQTVIDDAAWVVSGYLLAYTVSMMFMGRVSDLIGRRKVYIVCLGIFIAGSILVAEVDPEARQGAANVLYSILFRVQGVRPDGAQVALYTIILGRVVQALGAGALVPVSLALVGDLFPPERRAQPLGVIGAVDTMGWVLGHLYGGILVNHFNQNQANYLALFHQLGLNWVAPDWRALFWINVPVTLVVLFVTWWMLRDVPQECAQGRFDFLGTLLIAGSLIALVLGLGANFEIATTAASFEDIGGLPPYAAPLLLLSAALFVGFVFVERRVRDPLFDLRIFKRRNLSAGLLTNLFVGFCLMIGLVSVPILVNVRVEDTTNLAAAALQVGILLSALTVPMALSAVPGGWLSERLGYGKVAAGGLLLALVGFLFVGTSWTLEIPDTTVAIHMALIGIGLGLTFSPISAAVINSADRDRLGVASALVIILRLVGMTISVSVLTTIASQRLAYLAARELGTNAADLYANVGTYAHLTVRVLAEIGLLGAAVCGVALIPALLLRGRDSGERLVIPQDEKVASTSGD
jgi:MFS family permease